MDTNTINELAREVVECWKNDKDAEISGLELSYGFEQSTKLEEKERWVVTCEGATLERRVKIVLPFTSSFNEKSAKEFQCAMLALIHPDKDIAPVHFNNPSHFDIHPELRKEYDAIYWFLKLYELPSLFVECGIDSYGFYESVHDEFIPLTSLVDTLPTVGKVGVSDFSPLSPNTKELQYEIQKYAGIIRTNFKPKYYDVKESSLNNFGTYYHYLQKHEHGSPEHNIYELFKKIIHCDRLLKPNNVNAGISSDGFPLSSYANAQQSIGRLQEKLNWTLRHEEKAIAGGKSKIQISRLKDDANAATKKRQKELTDGLVNIARKIFKEQPKLVTKEVLVEAVYEYLIENKNDVSFSMYKSRGKIITQRTIHLKIPRPIDL